MKPCNPLVMLSQDEQGWRARVVAPLPKDKPIVSGYWPNSVGAVLDVTRLLGKKYDVLKITTLFDHTRAPKTETQS